MFEKYQKIFHILKKTRQFIIIYPWNWTKLPENFFKFLKKQWKFINFSETHLYFTVVSTLLIGAHLILLITCTVIVVKPTFVVFLKLTLCCTYARRCCMLIHTLFFFATPPRRSLSSNLPRSILSRIPVRGSWSFVSFVIICIVLMSSMFNVGQSSKLVADTTYSISQLINITYNTCKYIIRIN